MRSGAVTCDTAISARTTERPPRTKPADRQPSTAHWSISPPHAGECEQARLAAPQPGGQVRGVWVRAAPTEGLAPVGCGLCRVPPAGPLRGARPCLLPPAALPQPTCPLTCALPAAPAPTHPSSLRLLLNERIRVGGCCCLPPRCALEERGMDEGLGGGASVDGWCAMRSSPSAAPTHPPLVASVPPAGGRRCGRGVPARKPGCEPHAPGRAWGLRLGQSSCHHP